MNPRTSFIQFACLLLLATNVKSPAAGLDDLVAPGAQVEKLAGGFRFTEGPARDARGDIYFSDIPNNRIHKWSGGKLTTFREDTGGANGLYFDRAGNLLACEGGARRVSRTTMDGKTTTVVDSFDGRKLNSPNDLWIAPDGGIYFTDPRYGKMEGLEQGGFHVYFVPPGGAKAVRVLDKLVKPNGIVGTADGKLLYVADPGDKKTFVYRVGKDGALTDRRIAAESGSDGMTLDERGNLYLTAGTVKVYSPTAELIGEIKLPEGPANVTFGGADGRTLYITARTGFYSLRMRVKGQ